MTSTAFALCAVTSLAAKPTAEASSSTEAFGPGGVLDGNRFTTGAGHAWKGEAGKGRWWWQVQFDEPRRVGAILQVIGDHDTVLRNAPGRYVWRWSADGRVWRNLLATETMRERRLFRVHRLRQAVRLRYLRLEVFDAIGEFPTLRDVELYPETDSPIAFGDWLVAVSIAESSSSLAGGSFIRLARDCKGWESTPAQHIWVGDFDEAYCAIEPRPLCALISGSYREWCERMHAPFRGLDEVLRHRRLPMWAACGGAQLLAMLTTVRVDDPWDCPRCRDPKTAKLPVYSHIGFADPGKEPTPCGDYSNNIGERGPKNVLQVARDPAFRGLPRQFLIPESHIGQIAFVPEGWQLVATAGEGAKTKVQCIRVKDRYIYSAQFHIEMGGAWENSKRIMGNFLTAAKGWGGYNPAGKLVPLPPPWSK